RTTSALTELSFVMWRVRKRPVHKLKLVQKVRRIRQPDLRREGKVLPLIVAEPEGIVPRWRLVNDVGVAVAIGLFGESHVSACEPIVLAAKRPLGFESRQRAQMRSLGSIFVGGIRKRHDTSVSKPDQLCSAQQASLQRDE